MSARRTGRAVGVLVLSIVALGALPAQDEFLAASLDIQAVSADREAVTEELAAWAEENGGYYTYRSGTEIHLRVVPSRISEVRAVLETTETEIIRYDPSTVDYRRELADTEAAITARTEALERVLRYLDGATIGATLEFERELRSLNQEIELYAGRARRIRNDIRFARVSVVLSSYEQTIPYLSDSSFDWINDLGMYSFLETERYRGRYR